MGVSEFSGTTAHLERFSAETGERIYRIPCDLHRALVSYVYLILSEHSPPTLIDCGTGEANCLQEILAGFAQIRSRYKESFVLTQLERIIITHAHIDHGGGTAFFVQNSGAEVMCHTLDASVITRYDERALLSNRRFNDFLKNAGIPSEKRTELIQAFGFTPGRAMSVQSVKPLEDGERLDNLTLCHTPGHSPGHLCIQVGNQHMILGDIILSKTLTPVWPERISPNTGLAHFFDSVKKIRDIAPNMTGLPGHEQAIASLLPRIDTVEQSHHRRLERVLNLLRESDEPLSLSQLAGKMYIVRSGMPGFLALIDIGARVEYLEQRNFVSVVNAEELEQEKTDVFLYRTC
ncbi:MAG: MBL fold metallo-hydrolase [Planctomycetaceae bacterium]|jgi:glyoxylase-like metal-dependent hydrolase (beta-lactamase superfamily II)|nr:MBL fold metallo-hydrolase [Planctomycetaceae bacterium]